MTTPRLIFAGLVLAALLSAACSDNDGDSEGQPHWSYEGEAGPSYWSGLDESYAACGTGRSQSPINVNNPAPRDLANVIFHYQPSTMTVLNNGHTVQVNYDPGSYIELDGVRYDLVQFHYHAPSEHTVRGVSFPAELHIVHRDAANNLAVLGILIHSGAANRAYEPFINNLPPEEAGPRNAGVTIDASGLLPAVKTTFRYTGSLTTPPCSEGVSWLIMTTPVEISAQQLDTLESVFEHGNNRPVQAINERTLTEDTTP